MAKYILVFAFGLLLFECVEKGCSGCTKNSDCYTGHVCCKTTLPLEQNVCASNCINRSCNSNDDCSGWSECCRSGKCTRRGCGEKCASDSECNLDQYCCNKRLNYWGDNCAKTCVGELCRTDRDCGARNECCISDKCVDRGCSGCSNNSNCSDRHYCCRGKWYAGQWYSSCRANCIGKLCDTNDDCGGPGETCGSGGRCALVTRKQTTENSNTQSASFPPWLIAVLTLSLVVFFTAVGVLIAVFWYVKRKRPSNASQAGTVSLQNTQYQAAEVSNRQQNTQFSNQNNPSAFRNQLQHVNYKKSHTPIDNPQRFQTDISQSFPSNQGIVSRSPITYPQHGNENPAFHLNPAQNQNDQRDGKLETSDSPQYYNVQHEPFYNTLESTDTT